MEAGLTAPCEVHRGIGRRQKCRDTPFGPADHCSEVADAKPKTSKRKVEPKAPPVVQPDIGSNVPPPSLEPAPPRRSSPGRWFNNDAPAGSGIDPAGRN